MKFAIKNENYNKKLLKEHKKDIIILYFKNIYSNIF